MYEPQDSPDSRSKQVTSNVGNNESTLQARLTDAQGLEVFTSEEASKLMAARSRYLRGKLNESSTEHKRLLFARWLHEHGKLAR
jgi:hypothetical protein